MTHTMHGWTQKILQHTDRLAMPIMTYPGLALTGQTVRDVVTSGAAQFACMKALGEKYPALAALTLMDLSVEAEAFGCPVKFSDDEVPTVTAPIIREAGDLERLAVPKVGAGRTGVYLEAARRAVEHYQDRPVLGGMIGPYSLAVRLRDMTQVMLDIMLQPEFMHRLLERCTAFLVEYARAFRRLGAGGLVIAEPAAGLLSPEQCEAFSSGYVRRIVEAVQDDGFMVILHNCGRTTQLVDSLAGTGARGLHFGNSVEMMDILPQVPEDVLVFGNIDPAGVLKNGRENDVYLTTLRLLMRTAEYPNFVLSSGCDIPPGTPLENVNAFFGALTEYNALMHRARTRYRKAVAA